MTDGANTPPALERDFSYLGPATLAALHVGIKACDDSLAIYDGIGKTRELTTTEKRDRAKALESRHTLLTQPYPPPYVEGARHGANDSGSQSGKDEAAK